MGRPIQEARQIRRRAPVISAVSGSFGCRGTRRFAQLSPLRVGSSSGAASGSFATRAPTPHAARSRVRSAARGRRARAGRRTRVARSAHIAVGAGRRARVRSVAHEGERWPCRGPDRVRRRGGVGLERLLGLERLERAQRAPELGHRRAAIAQQRLERARAVAIPDQGEPEAAARDPALLEQLGFDAVRPRETPRGDRDAAREHGLQRADRRQLRDQRRLEIGELGGILVRQHEMLLRAHAVLERILRRPGLAFVRLRPARLRAVLAARLGARIADGTAARGAAPALDMAGIPCWVRWGLVGERRATDAPCLGMPPF